MPGEQLSVQPDNGQVGERTLTPEEFTAAYVGQHPNAVTDVGAAQTVALSKRVRRPLEEAAKSEARAVEAQRLLDQRVAAAPDERTAARDRADMAPRFAAWEKTAAGWRQQATDASNAANYGSPAAPPEAGVEPLPGTSPEPQGTVTVHPGLPELRQQIDRAPVGAGFRDFR